LATCKIYITRALNAIKIIRKHFNTRELLLILTSNFYSILYYNSEAWMLNNLNANLKRSLLSTSVSALKMALLYPKHNINYINLHQITKLTTVEVFGMCKLELLLFKVYNDCLPNDEWVQLNVNQYFTSRQTFFRINTNNLLTCGTNELSNKLHHLNGLIKLDHLNLNYTCYKIECKKLFMTNFR
jgi:hypothetical protein